MDRRNIVFSIVQDGSKIQTFTPTLFKMSTQQQQQQQTAEKSVQTQDSSGSTTLVVTNNPVTHIHTENTAAEVANTLVSMATGRQRGTTVKQLNVISVPTQSNLPILSLADYTTSRGVPTAMALANQAKLTPTKQNDLLENNIIDDDDDEESVSNDEFNSMRNDVKTRNKTTRRLNKSSSTSKSNKQQTNESIQYGPITVKPRKNIAPTLANGRKSKDEPLPPEEDLKRQQRRDRNKQAAAKCRRKRNELRETLEKTEQMLQNEQKRLENSVQILKDKKFQLEALLQRHVCIKKSRLPITTTNSNPLNISKTDLKTIPTTTLLDSTGGNTNNKRVTINFTNAQDLLAVAPLTRLTTNDGSSSVPMITIHILPEVAHALLGSTSVDRTKLAELLQQANPTNINSSTNSTS